jgi:acetolactate synthase-1/2/3 large subunit
VVDGLWPHLSRASSHDGEPGNRDDTARGAAQERISRNADLAGKIAARGAEIGKRHQRLRAEWRKEAEKHWNKVPMTVPRLALEVWRAIKDEDRVLSAGTLHGWARKLWNFDRSYRHAGRKLGTGTQIGTSLGVALANKGTGRLVVDLQPDGDLMYDAGALWIAAKYQIPLLIVMYNNRACYNDWNHQIVVARTRGTDPNRAHIGMDLFGPAPDFTGLARSMGGGPKAQSRRPTISSGRWRRSRRASRRWSTR